MMDTEAASDASFQQQQRQWGISIRRGFTAIVFVFIIV
jgi:hypothetical protein